MNGVRMIRTIRLGIREKIESTQLKEEEKKSRCVATVLIRSFESAARQMHQLSHIHRYTHKHARTQRENDRHAASAEHSYVCTLLLQAIIKKTRNV